MSSHHDESNETNSSLLQSPLQIVNNKGNPIAFAKGRVEQFRQLALRAIKNEDSLKSQSNMRPEKDRENRQNQAIRLAAVLFFLSPCRGQSRYTASNMMQLLRISPHDSDSPAFQQIFHDFVGELGTPEHIQSNDSRVKLVEQLWCVLSSVDNDTNINIKDLMGMAGFQTTDIEQPGPNNPKWYTKCRKNVNGGLRSIKSQLQKIKAAIGDSEMKDIQDCYSYYYYKQQPEKQNAPQEDSALQEEPTRDENMELEDGKPVGGLWYCHGWLRGPVTAAVPAKTGGQPSQSSSCSMKPKARSSQMEPAEERKPKKCRATSDSEKPTPFLPAGAAAMTTNETRRGPPTSPAAGPSSSVAIKQEPPDDNSVCIVDISDISTEPVAPAIPSAVFQHHGSSLGDDDIHDDRQDRIHQIREWMATDVIGNNPSLATMMRYASKLYGIGFESVELIKAHLQPAHVEEVGMAPLHQEIVLKRLNDGW